MDDFRDTENLLKERLTVGIALNSGVFFADFEATTFSAESTYLAATVWGFGVHCFRSSTMVEPAEEFEHEKGILMVQLHLSRQLSGIPWILWYLFQPL